MVRPSTWITSSSRSALLPSSRTILPLTVTCPCSMRISAFRREATPAWARIFCSLSSIVGLFRGRRRERGGGRLRGLVGLIHRALELRQRRLALQHRPRRFGRLLRESGQARDRGWRRRLLLDDLARLLRELLELAQRRELRQVAQVEEVEEL